MIILNESELECGCCITLDVTKDGIIATVQCHSIEEGIEKARKVLDFTS